MPSNSPPFPEISISLHSPNFYPPCSLFITLTPKQADLTDRACYLESSNDINPVIYAKLGFAIERKIHLTRGEKPVELDIMVREPSCPVKSRQHGGVGETAAKMASVEEKVRGVSKETAVAAVAAAES